MSLKQKATEFLNKHLGNHMDWVNFVGVVAVLLIVVGAITLFFSGKLNAEPYYDTGNIVSQIKVEPETGWRDPEYLIAFGHFKGNTLSRSDDNGNPGGIFQLQHGYQFHRNFAAVYGYLHISSAPLEDNENHHDAFYIGFHGVIK